MADARSEIFERIRRGLAAAYLPDARETVPLPPPAPRFEEPLADVFTRALTAVQGQVHRMATAAAALDFLLGEFADRNVDRLLGWDAGEIGLPGLAAALAAQGIEIIPSRLAATDERQAPWRRWRRCPWD